MDQKSLLEKKIQAIEITLALINEDRALAEPLRQGQQLSIPKGLRKMKQYEALEALARENGGKIKIAEVIPILQKLGLLTPRKHAWQVVYGSLKRRGNWEALGAGEYELVEENEEPDDHVDVDDAPTPDPAKETENQIAAADSWGRDRVN